MIRKILKLIKFIITRPHCSGVNKLSVIKRSLNLLWLKRGKRFEQIINLHGYKMMLNLNLPGIAEVLYVYRTREILETEIMKNEIYPDMNVIDIGANIGYYTLLEASRNGAGKIFAFEPDKRNYELLKKNIALNKLSNIKTYPWAVGEGDATINFYPSNESNLSSPLMSKKSNGEETVKCISLDRFSEINNLQINLVRMDVEGYECQVIDGMKEMLKNDSRLKLMIEVHPRVYNSTDLNFTARLKLLESIGYKIKYLVSAGSKLPELIERKYKARKVIREGKWLRGLYSNVKHSDLIRFLENDIKVVRAIFLEKK